MNEGSTSERRRIGSKGIPKIKFSSCFLCIGMSSVLRVRCDEMGIGSLMLTLNTKRTRCSGKGDPFRVVN